MSDPTAPRAALSPERWEQIQNVLAAAIDCETTERAHLLDARCAGDAELRREVESLLTAHDEVGFVDRLADEIAPAASWARAHAAGWKGARVGQYVITALVDAGGMGIVYKARDERLARHVALKFLPPHLSTHAAAKQRFLIEARAAAALDHPNVCTIHEIGETDDGQPFIAMALYDGETLQARLARGRLSFAEAARIATCIARGLGHAHAFGIVHRDLKPSNVMVLTDGTVKILDFGIAKTDDLSLTPHGAPLGTIAYMSPEHVRGGVIDHRSDIWSLAIVLHEMLTGRRPFDGKDRDTIARAILTSDPDLSATSHPDVPAGVDDLLHRALAKTPEQRPTSMALFAAQLEALMSTPDGESGVAVLLSQAPDDQRAMPAGERRRAAVLVTQVSDYDVLVEQVAPAHADSLVAQIRDLAVEVVRHLGGIVNQAIGEEIVSVFGVPMAHEDDELRAVRAALDLRAQVHELSTARGPAPIHIQSGLHFGPVIVQRLNEGPRRYAIVGAAGQVASRLAAVAPPDSVVLSAECQRRVAPFIHTAPYTPVLLDHETPPLPSFCVTGETGLETRLEASERSGLTPYVGRHSELALLDAHVARAHAGEGRVISVVGEAGAGKSRLLHELGERVATIAGVRVLHGRCRADGGTTPYAPFIDILREGLEARSSTASEAPEMVARIRAIDASLEPFVPLYLHLLSIPDESHPVPRHLQGEALHAALLDALAAVITVLTGRTAIVVLLEDWHWADAASRAALSRLTEIVAAHRLLVIVTTRPERSVVEDWSAHGTRLQLEPLDFVASAAIMQAVLRVERISDDLAQRVFERTGGNPFFLEQVCCALLEQGAIGAREGEAVVPGGTDALSLPDSVQAVIRTRLDTLEPHARDVLRVAAVIGREFDHALLADVLGVEVEVDLAAALVRLKASGLIHQVSLVPEIGYRFRHVLTQEVSYDSLLGHQRRSLHDAIGRAIERHHADRLDEHAALLAHHFGHAETWHEAVHYGQRAAQRASALSQFSDALVMLDQVMAWLAHLPDDEVRSDLKADLLLQQERECETLGLRGRQRQIIADVIAHLAPRGPSARLAEAYLREGDLLTLLKRFSAADRALSTALRVSREWGDAALERSTLRSLGLLRWHEGRHADALAITEHALSIDRQSGDELAVAGDLTNLGNILRSMGEYAAAIARQEESLALPSLARDPKKLAYALHGLANIHRCLGDTDAALACLDRADAVARANLLPIQRSFHLTSIAHINLQQGRIDSALRTYEEAVALSRRARHATGLAQSLRTLGDVLFGLGKRDQAMPYLREAATLFAQLEDPESEAEMWSRVAEARESASPRDALEAWRTTRALRQQLGDPQGELEALEGIARATRRSAATPPESIPAFETALALAATLGDTHRQLALHNVLGILEWERAAYHEALGHYEAALLLVRAHGDRVHEGLILNSLGATLSRLNRPEEARTALEESVALNRATGQRLLESHALSTLRRIAGTRALGD